jgi:hypothetical protein
VSDTEASGKLYRSSSVPELPFPPLASHLLADIPHLFPTRPWTFGHQHQRVVGTHSELRQFFLARRQRLRFHSRRRCVVGCPLDLSHVRRYSHFHRLVGRPNLLGLLFLGLSLGSLLFFGRL